MMNPFLQLPPEKAGKKQTKMSYEQEALVNDQSARNRSRRSKIGLWTGNLLIRIGKKLTEREIDMNTSKEHA
jgi:hypothetical protein